MGASLVSPQGSEGDEGRLGGEGAPGFGELVEGGFPRRRQGYSWAVLLARVFYVDALLCTKCGGKRKVLAFLTDPKVVKKILTHVGLESTPLPLSPARVPLARVPRARVPGLRLWEGAEWPAESGEASGEDSWEPWPGRSPP